MTTRRKIGWKTPEGPVTDKKLAQKLDKIVKNACEDHVKKIAAGEPTNPNLVATEDEVKKVLSVMAPEKQYNIFAITTKDIESAIRQYNKQLHDLSATDEEFIENRRAFNKMKKAMKENPEYHYDRIISRTLAAFSEIEYKFNGRFFDVVGEYMTSYDDARMDL